MEDKINELYLYIKDMQITINEIRQAQQGYMTDKQANEYVDKILDVLSGDLNKYFRSENHEFEISQGDRIEVYHSDTDIDDEELIHEDMVEVLLDAYGEPKQQPPIDSPQITGIPNGNTMSDDKEVAPNQLS